MGGGVDVQHLGYIGAVISQIDPGVVGRRNYRRRPFGPRPEATVRTMADA